MTRPTDCRGGVLAAMLTVTAAGCTSSGQDQLSSKPDTSPASLGAPQLNVPTAGGFDADQGSMSAHAVELLLQAAGSDDPLLRANAIEGLSRVPEQLDPVLLRGLDDPNRGVRFVAAMTAGKQRRAAIVPEVRDLLEDPSPSVRAAAMYALHRCGEPVDLNPLGRYLIDPDPEVRGNATMVLAELGEESAAPMIREALGRRITSGGPAVNRIVDLQMTEALVKLGDRRDIEVIHAALFTPAEQGEITALACMMVGRLDDRAAIPELLNLACRTGEGVEQPPEVRMAATYALGMIDPLRAPADVPKQFLGSTYPEQRAQAAMTLGVIGDPEALDVLRPILDDENPRVQVAAAAAIVMLSR